MLRPIGLALRGLCPPQLRRAAGARTLLLTLANTDPLSLRICPNDDWPKPNLDRCAAEEGKAARFKKKMRSHLFRAAGREARARQREAVISGVDQPPLIY